MTISPSIWRQAIWIGLSFSLGVVAVGAARGDGSLMTTLVGLAAVVALGMAWWRGHRVDASVATLQHYVERWESQLEAAELTDDTLPELEPLRFALQQTQRTLRRARGQRDQRISDLLRDTLLLQSVLGTMVEAVLVVDGDGRLLYANPAADRLLENSGREAAGKLLQEVARTPHLQALVGRVLKAGEQQHAEVELTRQHRLVTASCSPLPLAPRRGAVLVLHDVTQLRRLEQARREFASNVSHELKTPLTSIQAYADALLDGGLDDPHVNRGFVEQILQQSQRLHRLIMDLLNLSRIESQDHSLENERLNLNDIAALCLPLHASVAESRKVALSMELSPDDVVITADREALRTVIDNLLRNAITYTQPGGSVTLRTARRSGDACLEVEDTGIGIPREHQQRVFERFYRVDKARSREVGGTGLGLSIVKHFVEHFGAAIELESEQGQGSLFRVRWPSSAGQGESHRAS